MGEGAQTGAVATLRNCENPRIVDLTEDDVEDMVDEGNPGAKLKERELKWVSLVDATR